MDDAGADVLSPPVRRPGLDGAEAPPADEVGEQGEGSAGLGCGGIAALLDLNAGPRAGTYYRP